MPEQPSSKAETLPLVINHERLNSVIDGLRGHFCELDEAEREYRALSPMSSALTQQRVASRAHDLRTGILSATEMLDELMDSPEGSSCWYEHIQWLEDGSPVRQSSETSAPDQNSTNSLDFDQDMSQT